MFLDAQYKPTPVPLQTGRTNYVDNDRLGCGAAASTTRSRCSARRARGRAGRGATALLPATRTSSRRRPSPDGLNHTPALVADEVPDDSQVAGEPLAGTRGLQTNNPGWPGFGSSG